MSYEYKTYKIYKLVLLCYGSVYLRCVFLCYTRVYCVLYTRILRYLVILEYLVLVYTLYYGVVIIYSIIYSSLVSNF